MDLLSRLENVDIQIIDRFPPDDMEYCRAQERIYQAAYSIYSEVAFIEEDANAKLTALKDGDVYYIQEVEVNKDKIYKSSERFISRICGYFRKKHKVSVDEPDWMTEAEDEGYGHRYKTERYDMVPLQYILDSVYDQMGGMSFEEKAFNELKDSAREAMAKYNGTSKYRIQGIRLIVDEFFYSRKDSIYERYMASVESKHRAFFKALSHFEYGTYDLSHKYNFLCDYRIDENDGVYDKHPVSSSVVKSIKVFKNGKTEFEFKDYMTIVKFMDIYFPGLPQQAAA